MELHEEVRKNIRQHDLLARGAHVLIGVSGGADSIVLLHVLTNLAEEHQWSLAVGHFNHCLRGTDSERDEGFVRVAAAKLNLPVHVARGDVRARARQKGVSIEMAARELRHQFLVETARQLGSSEIALGHHADDFMETFWLRLLRGDVGPGLGGIRWKRAAGAESGIVFVRPLLNVWKADLLSYAAERGIAFREDASNQDPAFLRNRLRLEILPTLERFQPALREVSFRAAQVLADEKAFLESEAIRWLHSRNPGFAELHVALQREIVRIQLIDRGFKPTFEWIEELRTRPDAPICVAPAEHVLRKESGEVVCHVVQESTFIESEACAEIASPGVMNFSGVAVNWKLAAQREAPVEGVEFFDADAVGNIVRLRHWRPGDRFQPIGLAREAKLQDLFTNQKVAAAEKRRRIVGTTENGKIFWVEGLRISEQHKVTSQTCRVLRWSWRREC